MKTSTIIIVIVVILILFKKKAPVTPTTINYTTTKIDTLAMTDLERRIIAAEEQINALQQSPIA